MRRPTALALCLVAAALAACHDSITRPTSAPPLGAIPAQHIRAFSEESDFGSLNSPNSGNYDGVIDPWDGGAPAKPVGTFRLPTIITVHTSGSVEQMPGVVEGYHLVWGPAGTSDHQAAIGLAIVTTDGSSIWFSNPTGTASVKLVGEAFGLRSALNDPQPYGDPWWTCGRQIPDHNHPCWTFAGSAHLDFTRDPVAMTLEKSSADTVPDSTVVTFTAGREKDMIEDHPVDMSLLGWRWIPDSLVAPHNTQADTLQFLADTITCTRKTDFTCDHQMLRTGIMHASAYVNGEQFEKVKRVVIKRKPVLRLQADRTVIEAGDTISLTATAPGSTQLTVQRYFYVEHPPAAPPGPLALRMPSTQASQSAIVLRTIHLTPVSRSTIASNAACVRSLATTCIDDPEVQGTWHVTAIVDGETQEDSVGITVIPPEATLTCTLDAPATRGSNVNCEFKLKKPKAYTVTRHLSTIADGVLVDSSFTESRSAGQSHFWGGTAATKTTVQIDAKVGAIPVSATDNFAVGSRIASGEWAPPDTTITKVPKPIYTDALAGAPPGIYRVYPDSLLPQTSLDGSLGKAQFTAVATPGKARGPNEGLYFIEPVNGKDIWIHLRSALQAGSSFANAQIGGGVVPGYKTMLWCTTDDVETLRATAQRHEESHATAFLTAYLTVTRPTADTTVFRAASLSEASKDVKTFLKTYFSDVVAAIDRTHSTSSLIVSWPCAMRL